MTNYNAFQLGYLLSFSTVKLDLGPSKEKNSKNSEIAGLSPPEFLGGRQNELNNGVVLMKEIVEVAKRFRLEMYFVIGKMTKNSVNLM